MRGSRERGAGQRARRKRARVKRGSDRCGGRIRCLLVFRCRPRLRLLLFELLLLFFLCHVMPDCATGGGAENSMMARDMSCHRTDGGAL